MLNYLNDREGGATIFCRILAPPLLPQTPQYLTILMTGRRGAPTGAFPGFGRGGPRIFFSDLEICMSRSDMLRMAKPCALLGGFGGMPPRENFLKWCNLVRFGVYFDQILYLKILKITIFYIKILKIAIFYIKE